MSNLDKWSLNDDIESIENFLNNILFGFGIDLNSFVLVSNICALGIYLFESLNDEDVNEPTFHIFSLLHSNFSPKCILKY